MAASLIVPGLPTVLDFAAEAADAARYAPLGPDWSVAVADVVGSTRLAAEARDRDVNFVAGAAVAVLTAAIRGDGDGAACVQFGGDGAVAAVPPGRREAVEQALAALVHWSVNDLDVPIRAGVVPVSDLLDAGLEVRAALHEIDPGNHFGLFLGAGVAAAESWVKTDPRRQVDPAPGPLPGIEALSCRWQPVPSRRGVVLCAIIDPVARGAEAGTVLNDVLAEIETIVPTADAGPLGRGERLLPKWPPSRRSLWLECQAAPRGRRWRRFAFAIVGSLIIQVAHALDRPLFGFDTKHYRRKSAERSDYRKAAGGPRLVLDVTEAEAAAIESLLERRAADGSIRYGVARADATTITCLVGDLMSDRHVHFVDGAGIGFWRASVMLKERFAAAQNSVP